MATIRKEISTNASADAVWSALRDVGALHTRLVPGFVVDTRLEPGERIVTFFNGLVVRERIVTVDEEAKRVVWSVVSDLLTHHNGSAQVVAGEGGQTKVVWIADFLPDSAAGPIAQMMEQGMIAMRASFARLAD